jgi:hypothetical protein
MQHATAERQACKLQHITCCKPLHADATCNTHAVCAHTAWNASTRNVESNAYANHTPTRHAAHGGRRWLEENGGGSDRATSSASPPFGSAAMTTIRGLIPDESAPHCRDLCVRCTVAIYVIGALSRFMYAPRCRDLCAPRCRNLCMRRTVAIYVRRTVAIYVRRAAAWLPRCTVHAARSIPARIHRLGAAPPGSAAQAAAALALSCHG